MKTFIKGASKLLKKLKIHIINYESILYFEYLQLGPCLPLHGPGRHNNNTIDIFPDLKFLKNLLNIIKTKNIFMDVNINFHIKKLIVEYNFYFKFNI